MTNLALADDAGAHLSASGILAGPHSWYLDFVHSFVIV